jgi:hypothetical protein
LRNAPSTKKGPLLGEWLRKEWRNWDGAPCRRRPLTLRPIFPSAPTEGATADGQLNRGVASKGPAEPKSDSLGVLAGRESPPPTIRGLIDSTGRKTGLAAMLAARRTIKSVEALQQSGHGREVPSATSRCCHPLLVQLGRDGVGGDEARSPEFPNCRSHGLGSHVCRLLVPQSIIDIAICTYP